MKSLLFAAALSHAAAPAFGAPPTLNSSVTYTYDAVGNRLTEALTRNGTLTQRTFGYDNLYQLTGVTGSQAHSYQYDPVGNRQVADGTAYTPNPLNQYAIVNGVNLTYDLNGNLTNDGTKTYAYDFENRLTSVSGPGLTVTYAYDPFGRRIEKNVNGTVTRYLYDGDQILEERNASNQVIASYIYGPGIDEPLTMTRGGQTYYYFQDGLGSVTELTNAAGEVVESYSYDPYGQPTPAVSIVGNPYRFTGREYDSETGLYYYRARYYSPTLGRFLQRDPLTWGPDDPRLRVNINNSLLWQIAILTRGEITTDLFDPSAIIKAGVTKSLSSTRLLEPSLLHRYTYVGNNSVNFSDPYGLVSAEAGLILGIALAQIAAETVAFYFLTGDLSNALLATGYWQMVKLGAVGVLAGAGTTLVGFGVGSPWVVGAGASKALAGGGLIAAGLSNISDLLKGRKRNEHCNK